MRIVKGMMRVQSKSIVSKSAKSRFSKFGVLPLAYSGLFSVFGSPGSRESVFGEAFSAINYFLHELTVLTGRGGEGTAVLGCELFGGAGDLEIGLGP